VRWATPGPAESFDPYGNDILFTIWVQRQVYEALIDYDRDGWLEPKLATNWKRLDATTWELELRPGIAFHDGTSLTSADVVFSIERAKAENSTQRAAVSGVGSVEAVDADTLRFTAAVSSPTPWEDLASLPILSKAWRNATARRCHRS
jgi:peptide/nickel transport system substrate-binding protein